MIYKDIEICEVRTSFGDACLKLYKITGHTFPDAEKNSLSALYHSHFYYECHILTAGVRKARRDFFLAEQKNYITATVPELAGIPSVVTDREAIPAPNSAVHRITHPGTRKTPRYGRKN